MVEEVKVAEADEIPPGEGRVVELDDKVLAVFNVDGNYCVIDNTCLHRGGPLGEGELEDSVVTCPWHGWQYDVTSGQVQMNPNMGVKSYEVRVVDGEVRARV